MSTAITLQALEKLDEKSRIELLMSDLNPEQRKAAMTLEGPVAAIAGAGSGKTKTLIHRTAHLLLKGVPATNILLVTFTNQGATEIKERLAQMVGEDAQYITAGTFHSIIYRCILKQYADHAYLESIGLNMNECTIIDESEMDSLFDEALKNMGDDEREMIENQQWQKDIRREMDQARAKGQDSETYAREKIGYGDEKDMLYRLTTDVWNRYSEMCRAASAIDFDDILVVTKSLMMKDPAIGQELAERFRYVMLDEYQDTNPVQMYIMDQIAKHHENIFVVGDEKQSIYAFRGADITVIIGFKNRYKDPVIIDMGTNYRSTVNILGAANVVAKNMGQKLTEGRLLAGKVFKGDGEKVSLVEFQSDRDEARMVVAAIRRDIARGTQGKDIAVLYRSRMGVKTLIEQELVKSGIDYRIIGDTSFYQRMEVRDAIALLRMTFRPWDAVAIFRVLKNTSFGVSDASAKKAMSKKGQTPHAYLTELASKTRGNSGPTAVALKVAPLIGSMQCIRKLVAYGEDIPYIRKSVERVWETYLLNNIKKSAEKDKADLDAAMESRMQNVGFLFDRFFSELEDGRAPEDILDELSLLGEGKNQTERDQINTVNLMTIHASKGKEFKNVYIPGMDLDTTPGEKTEDEDDLEEERRIFYVGITRAMEKLAVSFSREKLKYGTRTRCEVSPYLNELSKGLSTPLFKYRANEPSGPGR